MQYRNWLGLGNGGVSECSNRDYYLARMCEAFSNLPNWKICSNHALPKSML